jgi:hypothetical protein
MEYFSSERIGKQKTRRDHYCFLECERNNHLIYDCLSHLEFNISDVIGLFRIVDVYVNIIVFAICVNRETTRMLRLRDVDDIFCDLRF